MWFVEEMSAVEELEKIQNDTEMEEVVSVLPKSLSNEHKMDTIDMKDGQESDSRPQETCTHPPEVGVVAFIIYSWHKLDISPLKD